MGRVELHKKHDLPLQEIVTVIYTGPVQIARDTGAIKANLDF